MLKDRTIRAIGLVHVDGEGNTVIRVRNCDEVVYIPPLDEPPKTADRLNLWPGLLVTAAAGLHLLITIKKRRTE